MNISEREKAKTLALTTILNIENKEKCTLVKYCKKLKIECLGERIPGCVLEKKLVAGNLTEKQKEDLKQIPILKHLLKLQDMLSQSNKRIKAIFNPNIESFGCPHLKNRVLPCNLALCVYYSPKIIKTRCILSYASETEEWLDIEKFSVLKSLSRKTFINLMFSVAIDKWEVIDKFLVNWNKDIRFCDKCGYLLSQCTRYPEACNKRNKVSTEVLWDIPSDIKEKYPLFLIISSCRRIFKDYAEFLIPKEILEAYPLPLAQG